MEHAAETGVMVCPRAPVPKQCELGSIYPVVTLRLKIAQKPSMVWSLGPKALNNESLEP